MASAVVPEEDLPSTSCDRGVVDDVESTVVVCEDTVKRILGQPFEEMSILRLMREDPQIREIFVKPPQESRNSMSEDELMVVDSVPSSPDDGDVVVSGL